MTPVSPSDVVAVVVVNWNAWRLSLACLNALRTSVDVAWHLYLVDNASTDDSQVQLQNLGDDVTLILAPCNGGWTGGNNLAIERALADGHDEIFILNNDAEVLPETIAALRDFYLAHGGQPIVGPIHLDGEGDELDFIGAKRDARTGMPTILPARGVDPVTLLPDYPTAFVKGAAIFATRTHFDRIGLFDPRFYLNYDDTDWCFRARAAGFDVRMLASTHVLHSGSGSIGGALSPLNIYFLARNELLFARLHCTLAQRLAHLVAFLHHSNRIPSYPTRLRRLIALFTGRAPTVRAWRHGVRDHLFGRYGNCPAEIRQLAGARS